MLPGEADEYRHGPDIKHQNLSKFKIGSTFDVPQRY